MASAGTQNYEILRQSNDAADNNLCKSNCCRCLKIIGVVLALMAVIFGVFLLLADEKVEEDAERECHGCEAPWIPGRVVELCFGVKPADGRRLHDRDEKNVLGLKKGFFDGYKMSIFHLPNGIRVGYYGSAKFDNIPKSAKYVIFFIHGALRDALDYFCSLRDIVEVSTMNEEEAMIVAPRFEYNDDTKQHPHKEVVWWNGSHPWGDWKSGGDSDVKSGHAISSFDVLDAFILHINNKTIFPLLKQVMILGHSAGGQTVHRYALTSRVVEDRFNVQALGADGYRLRRGLSVMYAIANPSSYTYLDENRWNYDCPASESHRCTKMEYTPYQANRGRSNWISDRRRYSYSARRRRRQGFEASSNRTPTHGFVCQNASFNSWPYGLNWTQIDSGNIVPYLRNHWGLPKTVELYAKRSILYLAGQNDTCTYDVLPFCYDSCWRVNDRRKPCEATSIDTTCPAMLQGPMRNQRAKNYWHHLDQYYEGSRHEQKFQVVPNVGHQAEKMYTTAIKVYHDLNDDDPNT